MKGCFSPAPMARREGSTWLRPLGRFLQNHGQGKRMANSSRRWDLLCSGRSETLACQHLPPQHAEKNPIYFHSPLTSGNSPSVATEQVQSSPDVNILRVCITCMEKCQGCRPTSSHMLTHRGGRSGEACLHLLLYVVSRHLQLRPVHTAGE